MFGAEVTKNELPELQPKLADPWGLSMRKVFAIAVAVLLLAPHSPAAAREPSTLLAEADALFANGLSSEAVAKVREAAEDGSPEAQAELAALYFLGQYLNKDHAAAERYLRLALRKPRPEYQRDLACVIYHRADGKASDEYIDLVEKAAASDDTLALVYLSRIYRDGIGRKPNISPANFTLERALAKVHGQPPPVGAEENFLRGHLPVILGEGICGPVDSNGALLAKFYSNRFWHWPPAGRRRGFYQDYLLLPFYG